MAAIYDVASGIAAHPVPLRRAGAAWARALGSNHHFACAGLGKTKMHCEQK